MCLCFKMRISDCLLVLFTVDSKWNIKNIMCNLLSSEILPIASFSHFWLGALVSSVQSSLQLRWTLIYDRTLLSPFPRVCLPLWKSTTSSLVFPVLIWSQFSVLSFVPICGEAVDSWYLYFCKCTYLYSTFENQTYMSIYH